MDAFTPVEVERIVKILDDCARAFTFPMLDNGFVYPAAARLGAFSDGHDWAVVIETFGYSPRTGLPDLTVQSYGSQLIRKRTAADFVSEAAYLRFIDLHPFDEFATFTPLAPGDWCAGEVVDPGTRRLALRGRQVDVATLAALNVHDIEPVRPEVVSVADVARHLAATRQRQVLATPDERRNNIAADLPLLLSLTSWHHPDLADGQLPSETETFRQLAWVLATGVADHYRPRERPNTDWRNWPDGGGF